MTVDQRLFDYPLELQRERLRWRLDGQLADLARAVSKVGPLQDRRDALSSESVEVAGGLAQAQARPVDPVRTRQGLAYLAALQQQHTAAQRALESAEAEVVRCRQDLAATQTELDALEADRAASLQEHLRDRARLVQRDTDQDWTARTAWRDRVAANEEASR